MYQDTFYIDRPGLNNVHNIRISIFIINASIYRLKERKQSRKDKILNPKDPEANII